MNTKSAHYSPADTLSTVQALFTIYIGSAERLTELALAATRKTLDDCATAAKIVSEMKDANDLGALQSALGKPAFDRAIAYSRDSYAVLAEAQADTVKLMQKASSAPKPGFTATPDWSQAFDAFSRGARQLSEMTAANVAAVSAASGELIADAEASKKKAA